MKTDVCIIGSGVAGSTVAGELLDRGVGRVTMVECGPALPMRSDRFWHDVVMAGRATWSFSPDMVPYTLPAVLRVPLFDLCSYREQDFEESGNTPFGLTNRAYRARGGSTVAWDGWGFRLQPEDLRLRSGTGRGVDWPLSYDELEPYYVRAERTLQVAGDESDGGHPPRSSGYALPPFPYQRSDEPFLLAMEALGHSCQHMVISRNSEVVRGMPRCQNTGTCAYCPIGARFTGDQPLDRLERRKGFTLLCETTARRLLMRSRSEVRALEVLDGSSNATYEIEAGHFVVCAGALESPKLLLASTSEWWPRGLGNGSGVLGRFLFNHPLLTVQPPPAASRRAGNVPAELDFPTASSRHFDDLRHQPTGKLSIIWLSMGPDIRWHMLQGRSRSRIREELSTGWPLGLVMLTTEQVPDADNRIELAEGQDSRGLPRTRLRYSLEETEAALKTRLEPTCRALYGAMGYTGRLEAGLAVAAHPMGTCRMSAGADDGVVDRDLAVFGVGNVSLCSSAVFPTGGAVNPTLTIVALAHRLGQHLGRGTVEGPKRDGHG